MPILIIVGGAAFVLLFVFFYRTAEFDLAGSFIATLFCAGLLALVIAATIYAGQIF